MDRKVVTLSNGKRVANFSSPHEFKFVDGTILQAVDAETAQRLKIDITEISSDSKEGDIELVLKLSKEVGEELTWWVENKELVDIVFCPLMVITAIKNEYGIDYLRNSPFRTVRIEDRITKVVSIEKQCL